MKMLTNREEIAKVLNFNNYPVLTINREDHQGFKNTDFAKGCEIRCEHQNSRYGTRFTRGYLYYQEGQYEISSCGIMITNEFGASQVLEMAKWANTPIVKANQEVVIIEQYPSMNFVIVRLMKTGEKVNPFCQTALKLYDVE